MFQLVTHGNGGATSTHPLSVHPLHVGRGAGNDLILLDEASSTRHFRVWEGPSGVLLEDLGSRNGTWVNGRRVVGVTPLQSGDEVRVGVAVRLTVEPAPSGAGAVPNLEDVDLEVRHAIRSDRFTIGAATGSDVLLPNARESVTLLVDREGSVRIGRDGDLHEISVDQPFFVDGRQFCLRRPRIDSGTTRDLLLPHELTPTAYAYDLEVRLRGGTGPEATFRHTRSGVIHRIDAENPALLLYLLARKHVADLSSGLPVVDAGWLGDDELAVGIWGRIGAGKQASNLNVLVWRVRKDVQAGGFDPWCLEKRRRHMRVRVERVSVL